jgi:pimeloyl-ACP methyl ester carboxylesterase
VQGTGVLVEGTTDRWFAADFAAKHPDVVARLMTMVADADNESYAKLCEALGTFDARSTLASIAVPMLVISGELDPGTPPAQGALIAAAVPGARQIVIDGVSHQAVVEKPALVGQLLADFFAGNR